MNMHSPVHPETPLQLTELEPGLFAYICIQSGGVWIPLARYQAWKEARQGQDQDRPKRVAEGYCPVIADDDDAKHRALICPESGCLLIRYRVGQGLNFHVDLSPVTGGVWLDRGEWEALKSKGLHTGLYFIFTASYQRQIRNAEYEAALERTFEERIGNADFQRVTDFKQWLASHPKRRDIGCYLMDKVKAEAVGQACQPAGEGDLPAASSSERRTPGW